MCKNINTFCYICGKHVIRRHRISLTEKVESEYAFYFSKIVVRRPWCPKICCKTCYNGLDQWTRGKKTAMPFGIPMIWDYYAEHDENNCYACVNQEALQLNLASLKAYVYKSVPSVELPKPHSDEVPVPKKPSPDLYVLGTVQSSTGEHEELYDQVQEGFAESQDKSKKMTEQELYRLARKLGLSKKRAAVLAKELEGFNILADGVKVTSFRNRNNFLKEYFTVNEDNSFVYCHNITGLMAAMEIDAYVSSEWRLFIDSSQSSLKAILLHEENAMNGVPVAFGIGMAETYESIKYILDCIKYAEYGWRLCCDFKVITFLNGMQSGNTKYSCFICLWDSRYPCEKQYFTKEWPLRSGQEKGKFNVLADALVPKEKILIPPLHIKLGLVRSFIANILKTNAEAYTFLKENLFSHLTPEKLKGGECAD